MKEFGIHIGIDLEDGTVKTGLGATGTLDQPCKLGHPYVYLHKGPDGQVFYVGKGTGDRAYSKDRGPDHAAYVQNVLKGDYCVEIIRDGVSEDDAIDAQFTGGDAWRQSQGSRALEGSCRATRQILATKSCA